MILMVPVLQDLPLPLRSAPLVALKVSLLYKMGLSPRHDDGGRRGCKLNRADRLEIADTHGVFLCAS